MYLKLPIFYEISLSNIKFIFSLNAIDAYYYFFVELQNERVT